MLFTKNLCKRVSSIYPRCQARTRILLISSHVFRIPRADVWTVCSVPCSHVHRYEVYENDREIFD